MTEEFVDYALTLVAVTILSCFVIRWRYIRQSYRLIGWYIGIFLLTYLVRPLFTEYLGDDLIYRLLQIGTIERSVGSMTLVVSLAILSVAIGYRFGHRASLPSPESSQPLATGPNVSRRGGIAVATLLTGWGYFSITLSEIVGGGVTNPVDILFGVYEGNTFWLAGSALFISTGATVLYIVTGRLSLSVAVALPWLFSAIGFGYGRINVVGFLIALLAVRLMKGWRTDARWTRGRLQALFLGALLVVILIVVFPGTKLERSFFSDTPLSRAVPIAVANNLHESTWVSTTSDIAGFETTLYHLQVSDRPALGTYYLYYYFIRPIPRLMWPEKPVPPTLAEEWLGIPFDPHYFGFAPGSVGMAYQQWGWWGIPGEFLLTGWFLAKAERWVRRRFGSYYAILAYAGIFSLIPQLGRDSLLYMISDRWLFVYGAPVVILWALGERRGGVLAKPSFAWEASSAAPSR